MDGPSPPSKPLTAGDLLELRIDSLAAGGDGVGRAADGRAVFVPLSAPGDLVRARIERVKPRFARAELEQVLEAGPGRAAPRCPVFGECGGCRWQHLDYATQCEAKRRIVEDALARVGHLELDRPVTLLPSPDPWAYRARVRVAVRSGRVGYRRRRSHEVCPTARCPIATEAVEARLAALSASPPRGSGDWEIAAAGDVVRVHSTGSRAEPLELDVAGEPLRVSAGVFFQAHAGLHDALVAALARVAGSGGSVLELYAGAGFFTLRLARAFERVVAVEASAAAADDLRHNLSRAGLSHVEVLRARVEEVLARRPDGGPPDALVLDPPRSGLPPGCVPALAALGARRIAYLSCDPATLARDLAGLVGAGYALEEVEAFDLFPQTPHVEVLAGLSRA